MDNILGGKISIYKKPTISEKVNIKTNNRVLTNLLLLSKNNNTIALNKFHYMLGN